MKGIQRRVVLEVIIPVRDGEDTEAVMEAYRERAFEAFSNADAVLVKQEHRVVDARYAR